MKIKIKPLLGFTIISTLVLGCEKKDATVLNPTPNGTFKTQSINNYSEEKRSYVWVEGNTKLDCTAPGTGCVVKSGYNNPNLDITINQVLSLMDAGKLNLNSYIVNNDLSLEFPHFYEQEIFNEISNHQRILCFEFPYLFVKKNGETIKIYNYETTISDLNILSRLNSNGYTKKISFDTATGGIWKCTEAGDNCKVQPFKININWIAKNPQFAFIPNQSINSIIGFELDELNKKILFTNINSEKFGIEL